MNKKCKFVDLTGENFGDWTVLKQGKDKIRIRNDKEYLIRTWTCKCNCGYCNNIIRDVQEGNLINGRSKGCGGKSKSLNGKRNHKYNKYNLNGEYGVGYFGNNSEYKFYFDLEDYDKIKQYYWCLHSGHNKNIEGFYYVRAYKETVNKLKKYIFLHNIVMNNTSENLIVDHINGNPLDNRKENLRICTQTKNMHNRKRPTNNTSNKKGVSFSKNERKWVAYITINKNRIHLGYFKDKEDAINARIKAEEKYFGEFNREEE